jgi:polyhydroxyalkanoate synthesis regulator phasin
MPQPPDWKRVLETGMQFTELRRSQAHRLAIDLVAQGQLARDQIGAAVDELIDISRRRSEELRAMVSTEVQRQLSALGLATKRDLEALERRLRTTARPSTRSAGAGTAPAKKKTASKPSAKVPAKKVAAAKRAPRKGPAKKKAVPDKAAATKTAAKRTTASRSARKTAGRRVAANVARKPTTKRAR